MRLSVIICTRHRRASLERVLRSLLACEPAFDAGDWEVLVVDNGDPARAQPIDCRTFARLPLRIVREPRPGLSHARNRGVAESRGNWLLWTDDDTSVGRQWLRAYRRAMDAFPDAAVLGGPIHPDLEGQPPGWLTDGQAHIRSAFASREPDDVADTFRSCGPLPYGANFAIRRADALRCPFSPALGRHPDRPTRGWEEVFVIERILEPGGTGHWLRDAEVIHHIDPSRQTAAFIRAYYFDVGYVGAMRKATRMRRGFGIVVKLAHAVSQGVRCEATLALRTSQASRALLLRRASQSWGHARAWMIVLTKTDVVAAWRERACV